jgi:hypothetical protein
MNPANRQPPAIWLIAEPINHQQSTINNLSPSPAGRSRITSGKWLPLFRRVQISNIILTIADKTD